MTTQWTSCWHWCRHYKHTSAWLQLPGFVDLDSHRLCVSPARQRELTFNLMACEDMVTDKHSMAGCQSESVHCNKLMTG